MLSFLWLQIIPQVLRDNCMLSGRARLQQALWAQACPSEGERLNNSLFLSSPAHALLTQLSELRKQKVFLPTTSSMSLCHSLGFPGFNYQMKGRDWIVSHSQNYKILFSGAASVQIISLLSLQNALEVVRLNVLVLHSENMVTVFIRSLSTSPCYATRVLSR